MKEVKKSERVCPVEKAGSLDNKIRRWIQSPRKILKPFINEGMTVLDIGCGPGYFSIDLAQMVGKSGKVIAADLQEGMLHKVKEKIDGTELEERIFLHKCEEDRIGLSEKTDFVLAFYVIHELPNSDDFFNEIFSILKPNGKIYIVEPPFHVSKKAFEQMMEKSKTIGFTPVERPKLLFNKTVVLQKTKNHE